MAKGRVSPGTWTVEGFLREFHRVHTMMPDRSFCFLLGAGASVSSGIPPGSVLARRWVEELFVRAEGEESETSIEEWATPKNLRISDFRLDDVASLYPKIYDEVFRDDPESGYAYLEDVMHQAEPSLGYSILAQVLVETAHKIVITTNFDSLVADALLLTLEPCLCRSATNRSRVSSALGFAGL